MINLAYSGSFFKRFLTTILFLTGSYVVWSQGSDYGLTATIIGSGAPGYDEDRGGASVLISQGDTLILVDMGNGTQGNLNELGVKVSNISTLLFTHHHLDHNEEYIPILISSMLGRHKFQVFGPPGTSGLTESILALYESDLAYRLGKSGRSLGNRRDAYTVREISGGESFAVDGINISTVEVHHTIHTIAYRFDYEDQSIVISGDLTYTEALSLLAKDADILIMDSGGMIMKGSSGGTRSSSNDRSQSNSTRAHVNLEESSLMAAEADVETLVYTHFVHGEVDESASLEIIRQTYAGTVLFGEDLMVLSATEQSP